MTDPTSSTIAVIGLGARMPGAPDADTFFANLREGVYSISEVPKDRWDPAVFYHPDPTMPDRTYSRIGGFLSDFSPPLRLWRIPPSVAASLDATQILALEVTHQALGDAGLLERELPRSRCAVIFGNSMGGDLRDHNMVRLAFALFAHALEGSEAARRWSAGERRALLCELEERVLAGHAPISEDSMAGELSNVVAGRVAAAYRLTGPSFTVDAACASALAAVSQAVRSLRTGECDLAITGGVDRNMGASAYVKFCKTHALSATRSAPFDATADGFVMGEGAGVLVLKRLQDAERDRDRIRAVIRGVGASSDGGARGITAPNPDGQLQAMERAYADASVDPSTLGLVEAHGTSTPVGDAAEVETLCRLFGKRPSGAPAVAVGSVKSNIGHLKSAAGAAGLVKAIMALEGRVLPPTVNFEEPNLALRRPDLPFHIQTRLEPWETRAGAPRRAGVSAFGFGGTNFHVVLEEHGHLSTGRVQVGWTARDEAPLSTTPAFADLTTGASRALRGQETMVSTSEHAAFPAAMTSKDMPRSLALPGVAVFRLGAPDRQGLEREARQLLARARTHEPFDALATTYGAPVHDAPARAALVAHHAEELALRLGELETFLATGKGALRLAAAGTFVGEGQAPRLAFLYPGQGSQYVGMLGDLREALPEVVHTLAEADRVMADLLDRPLSAYLLGEGGASLAGSEIAGADAAARALQQTAITQPAMLAADLALHRVLASLGIHPDEVAGHSLGEYAAAVAAQVLPFDQALRAVAARGREMTSAVPPGADPGKMAVVNAKADALTQLLAEVDGYVVAANINSPHQTVIAGESRAVAAALTLAADRGLQGLEIPVSHAFHSRVVAAASEPLRAILSCASVRTPGTVIYSNVTAEPYPTDPEAIVDLLARQLASPVEFWAIVERMYERGIRTFVEVGPKKALTGFVRDILGDRPHRVIHTNHPKKGGARSLAEAIALLVADGRPVGSTRLLAPSATPSLSTRDHGIASGEVATTCDERPRATEPSIAPGEVATTCDERPRATEPSIAPGEVATTCDERPRATEPSSVEAVAAGATEAIWVTGVAAGVPGRERLFDDGGLDALLGGEPLLERLGTGLRQAVVDQRIERLVKAEDGTGTLRQVGDVEDVMRWAGRVGAVDLQADYRVSAEWDRDRDPTTRMAVAAAYEALRDAWLPLQEERRPLPGGRSLSSGFRLPPALGQETGVIFASAFPGYERLLTLHAARDAGAAFPRNTLLQILGLGHAHVAERLGALGPNLMVNAACASTPAALALASDWIRAGRCRRVLVVAADNVTSDALLPWIGGGFLALGAATTEPELERAAIPFGRNRHGLILGAGAVGFLLEGAGAATARGVLPLAELVATRLANSGDHPMRLRPEHIAREVDALVAEVTGRLGLTREALARDLVFVSHETFTPARGGSAQAEVDALRRAFGEHAPDVLVVNTKGHTGHPMAVGLEDAAAVAGLWRNRLPQVANLRDPDPDFSDLTFHQGGAVNRRYALRLAAGFGSQVALAFYRRADGDPARPRVEEHAYRAFLRQVCGASDPSLILDARILRLRSPERKGEAGLPDALDAALGRPSLEASPVASDDTRAATARRDPAAMTTLAAEPPALAPMAMQAPASAPAPMAMQAPAPAPLAEQAPAPAAERTPESAPASLAELAPASVPAAEQAPESAPSAPTTVSLTDLLTRLTAVVASRTGYDPAELEPDLELEADLGIDTVKQAEIVAELRSAYGLPRDDAFRLSEHPTLLALARYVEGRLAAQAAPAPASAPLPLAELAPASVPAAEQAPASAPSAPTTVSLTDLLTRLTAVVASRTGYDPAELEPDLELEADLGIDTVKQAEIVAELRSAYGLPRDDAFRLSEHPTLLALARYVEGRLAAQAAQAPAPVLAPLAEQALVPAPAAGQAPAPAPAAGQAPAPAPAAKQALVPTPSAPTTVSLTDLLTRLTAVVAGRTGYDPAELEPDLELEADLGIDTVKQAEIVAELRSAYGLPRDDAFRLSEHPTLLALARYVEGRLAAQATTAPAPAPAPLAEQTPPAAALAPTPVERRHAVSLATDLGQGFSIQRVGYRPGPAAQPPPEQGRGTVLVVGGSPSDATALVQGLGHEQALHLTLADLQATQGPDLSRWLADALVSDTLAGALWRVPAALPDADAQPLGAAFFRLAQALSAAASAPSAPSGAQVLPWLLLVVEDLRAAREATPSDTSLASHGSACAGAVAGLTRALGREWPACRTRVLAVTPEDAADVERLGGWLRAELAGESEDREIRRRGGRREVLTLGGPLEAAPRPFGPDDVVLVTGATGGIGALLARGLRERFGCRLLLTGRLSRPAASGGAPPDRAVARERLVAAGQRPTPAAVTAVIARWHREQALHLLLTQLEASGEVAYVAADYGDPRQVAALMEVAAQRFGRLDAVIHAAGIQRSRSIEAKTAQDFDDTFACKAGAAACLLEAASRTFTTPVRRFLGLGSVAGLLGNAGQTDYASANAALAGLAPALAGRGASGLTVHFTGWDDVGMTADPDLKARLADRGLSLLPPALGVEAILRLFATDLSGEVAVAGPLGELAPELAVSTSPAAARAASLAPAAARASSLAPPAASPTPASPPADRAALRYTLTSDLDWLRDHSLEGTPILPAVVGLEWMARAAALHRPGQRVVAVENARFSRPLKVHPGRPAEVVVELEPSARPDRLRAILRSERHDHTGRIVCQDHFAADLCLAPTLEAPAVSAFVAPLHLGPLTHHGPLAPEIYEHLFHTGRFRVLRSVRLVGPGGLVAEASAPFFVPTATSGEGRDGITHLAPLAVEAALQAAGLGALLSEDVAVLPAAITSLTLHADAQDIARQASWILRVQRRDADPQGQAPRHHRFDVDLLDDGGAPLLSLRNLELIQRAPTDPSRRPATPHALELVEMDLDTLGQPDSRVLDLGAELAPSEERRARAISHPGRRLEWIAGRLAAKELVRRHLRDRHGISLARGRVEIATEPGGAPVAWVPSRPGLAGLLPAISITHACGRAIALGLPAAEPGVRVGVDLTGVEARPESFAAQWLTDGEQRLLTDAPSPLERHRLLAELWSLKEAVSKALGLGLALATGELEIVEIDRRGNAQVALHGAAAERYADLGGRRLHSATQPWPGGVLSWARLELGTDREQHALPSLGPLEGAREGRLGSTP